MASVLSASSSHAKPLHRPTEVSRDPSGSATASAYVVPGARESADSVHLVVPSVRPPSFISARVVPQHSPAAVSALSDDLSLLSISPHTVLPPAFYSSTAAHNRSATSALRVSIDTVEPPPSSASIHTDIVIRSGWLTKRARGNHWSWNRRWFVLRPTQLAWYKDQSEYKASNIIQIADINTAAELVDDKRKTHFAVFTPSRNYHLQANSSTEAKAWVADIRAAIKTAEQKANEVSASESSHKSNQQSTCSFRTMNFSPATDSDQSIQQPGLLASGSNEQIQPTTYNQASLAFSSSSDLDLQGVNTGPNDATSLNDGFLSSSPEAVNAEVAISSDDQHVLDRDKVLQSGYLLRLVKKYNQWRKKWVVLRGTTIAFYKSEHEYRVSKIISLESVIDVFETDPISKSKQYCFLLILPEKRLRFCASSEDELTKWLVAIKAAIVRLRKSKS
ncbi:uncharacterized protein V1516DRAFT_677987 [Lipomyces oligophaga]|uniref:uncharacterized protein n=1 Tax=Lipomyces oligophaga TaxID=45792 RepID=UPI0034CF3FCB